MQRKSRLAVAAVLLTISTGCATQFAKQYQRAPSRPAQADQPLIGAYQGDWHSRTGNLNGPITMMGGGAKVVIDRPPDSTELEIWISLDNFWTLGTVDYDPATLHLRDTPSEPSHFTAKIAAGLLLVLDVDGHLDGGSTLSMKYKVVDVGDNDVQHNVGTITLHRASNHS